MQPFDNRWFLKYTNLVGIKNRIISVRSTVTKHNTCFFKLTLYLLKHFTLQHFQALTDYDLQGSVYNKMRLYETDVGALFVHIVITIIKSAYFVVKKTFLKVITDNFFNIFVYTEDWKQRGVSTILLLTFLLISY